MRTGSDVYIHNVSRLDGESREQSQSCHSHSKRRAIPRDVSLSEAVSRMRAGCACPGARRFLPVTLLISITMLAAACGGSAAPVTSAFPGAAANVSRLREAWTFKLAGKAESPVGSLTAPPVVVNGVVYLQDENANVYA